MDLGHMTRLLNFRNLVLLSPLLLLTVKHWTNVVVLVCFFASLAFLRKGQGSPAHVHQNAGTSSHWRLSICLALAGPFVAVAIGQILRGELYAPNLDAPLRMLMCVPIFLAACSGWLDREGRQSVPLAWAQTILPLTLLWTIVDRPSLTAAWGSRATTYFVDPLSFGSLCLLFAQLSLLALSLNWRRVGWPSRLLSMLGILCGMYMSIRSGSRTGWLGLPVFLTIWYAFVLSPALGRKRAALTVLVPSLVALVLVAWSPSFQEHIALGLKELTSYHWDAMNPDSSVGLRLSMYRMGVYYFAHAPLTGWGEHGWQAISNASEFTVFASQYCIHEAPMNGFHNEIITSSVRSGVWGLASATAFFAVPAIAAASHLGRRHSETTRAIALVSLVFITHLFMAALDTEVNNLVFLSAFNGLSLATLLGGMLYSASSSNAKDAV